MAAEQVGCPGDSADRFLSQGVPSPPFPRTLPETTPAAQPTPPAARPPHVHRGRSPHRRRSPLPSNRRRAGLAPARMLISPVPPRAGSRFPDAHRGSATLRRLASPAPLAAALRMLAGPAARPLRLGGAFLPRARRPRAALAAPRVLARPALGGGPRAGVRAERGARGRAGRAGVRPGPGRSARGSLPTRPARFLEPAFPGPPPCLGYVLDSPGPPGFPSLSITSRTTVVQRPKTSFVHFFGFLVVRGKLGSRA